MQRRWEEFALGFLGADRSAHALEDVILLLGKMATLNFVDEQFSFIAVSDISNWGIRFGST